MVKPLSIQTITFHTIHCCCLKCSLTAKAPCIEHENTFKVLQVFSKILLKLALNYIHSNLVGLCSTDSSSVDNGTFGVSPVNWKVLDCTPVSFSPLCHKHMHVVHIHVLHMHRHTHTPALTTSRNTTARSRLMSTSCRRRSGSLMGDRLLGTVSMAV